MSFNPMNLQHERIMVSQTEHIVTEIERFKDVSSVNKANISLEQNIGQIR